MRAFRFHLQRIMEFRHTRLAEEERKLKLLQMELNVVAEQIEDVRSARRQSASVLTSREALRGEDLRALAGFQARLRRGETVLQQKHAVCVRKLRLQEEAFKASRRDYRLLEELANGDSPNGCRPPTANWINSPPTSISPAGTANPGGSVLDLLSRRFRRQQPDQRSARRCA